MSALPTEDVELQGLLDGIFHTYHYDFRHYAGASLTRRVGAALAHFQCDSIKDLELVVLNEPRAFTELLGYFTVQVSDLFRDPSYFRAVRERVVPYLRTYPALKVWVAGCSTGEEAYSLAILFAEEGLLERTLIYATDINTVSLRIAEQGVYDVARFAHFSRSYLASGGSGSLSDWYTASMSSALLDRRLKKHILFCDHSLATDSVFAEVQLISCRNVLIYFDRELQNRAVSVLHGALCRKGFLGLGEKESLAFNTFAPSFTAFVSEERIYQRQGDSR
jgi:chemotaxis protein methyltransferase CheR